MTDLAFRPAALDDLPFIVGLIHEDSVVDSGEDPDPMARPYRNAFATIAADPNQLLVIAEIDGTPVGTFQLTFTPGIARQGQWRCTIEAVHVAPSHRNKGIGAAMMEWACETAKARGCGLAQLTSNKLRKDAHRFYTRIGFAQTHEGFKRAL
ncbi:GNAT family N-acetyltransferase [Pelagibacterium xiamenense]|uniref:GNAT family N-acetyltransferase n=1 Tax=Pelagibacterium xiamenense TaxID=2901140 RepID=UPI001E5DD386|nr:GNAT family N-acetyltransferase [Pelagibacterium xiamenense]MCD7060233.1 GNAT family N-acetyltransferase [Pelagibacterium xiamenense]